MAYAELTNDGRIKIEPKYRDKDMIRMVPGAQYKRQEWHAPATWSVMVALKGVFKTRLEVGPALQAEAARIYEEQVVPAYALRSARALTPDLAPLIGDRAYGILEDWHAGRRSARGFRMMPHQQTAVAFMAHSRQSLIADEMGAGKTVEGVMALELLDALGEPAYPALVIPPNSVKSVWESEFHEWAPDRRVAVIGGGAAKRRKLLEDPDYDVYVMNWEAVRLHSRLAPYGSIRLKRCEACGGADDAVKPTSCEVHNRELNEMGLVSVLADEAHKLKNPKAKQTRAAWAAGHVGGAVNRYAFTGTPIASTPDDLWSIMHFLAPEEFPSRNKFIDRYCMVSWGLFGGLEVVGIRPEHRDEFFSVLHPRMRRVTKAEVLKDLPPKVRQVRLVDMSPKQAKAYKAMSDDMIVRLESGVMVAPSPLTRAIRLMQFSSAYCEVDPNGDVQMTKPSNKVEALLELLDELGKEKLVVAAESRKLIMLANAELEEAGYKTRLIVGGMSDEARAATVAAFQEGDAQVCLMTIGAGGIGLTLNAARVMCFLQRSWSMILNLQAEDRVHRIGSEVFDSVEIIDLVSPGTIEEEQVQAIADKMARMDEVTQDAENMRTQLAAQGLSPSDVEERIEAFRSSRLAALEAELEARAAELVEAQG